MNSNFMCYMYNFVMTIHGYINSMHMLATYKKTNFFTYLKAKKKKKKKNECRTTITLVLGGWVIDLSTVSPIQYQWQTIASFRHLKHNIKPISHTHCSLTPHSVYKGSMALAPSSNHGEKTRQTSSRSKSLST